MLQVHAYDWCEKTVDDDDQTVIMAWTLDVHSKPHLLKINKFPVFCYIELPLLIKNKVFDWSLYQAERLMTHLRKEVKLQYEKIELAKRGKLYYHWGDRKFPFIRVFFNNIKEMKQCYYKLEKNVKTPWGLLQLSVLETDIPVTRKLLSYKNIPYSGWFTCHCSPVEDKISSIDEYDVDWDTMEPVNNNTLSFPTLLSWDIECYSSNKLAMPDPYQHPDVAYMISAIYKRYKSMDVKRFGIIYGDCDHIPEDKLENCIIIKTSSEYDMVKAFAEVIQQTDPEILIGYNIIGFDYPYLNHRIKRQMEQWPVMGRIIGEIATMSSTPWKSKAYSKQTCNVLRMSGRISIDLLPYIQSDYNFESYTLNYVAKHFINKEKYDVSAQEMFRIYEELQVAIATGNNLNAAKAAMTEVMAYCIRDAELVIELMEHLDVWTGLVVTSNIVGVTISDLLTKGQSFRCVSQLYHMAVKKQIVLNTRPSTFSKYKGGAVQKPIPGIYNNIICLDFKSLYPSIIQAYNMCFTTLIHPDHYHLIKDCYTITFNQDGVDYVFKFSKTPGLVPTLVKNLVAERNIVRGQQKLEKNPQQWMVLEKRQLQLKVAANSFYGFLGMKNGKINCMEAAMCITAKGRELIGYVGQYLNEKYQAKLVYGDSVSADTPILCQLDGKIFYRSIDRLPYIGNITYCHGNKEYFLPVNGLKVWSDQGFTDIKRIIRHHTNKKMYRVVTDIGIVDVTEDHSLLKPDGSIVKPTEVNIGTELLHCNLPVIGGTVHQPEAYTMGLYGDKIPDEVYQYDIESRRQFYLGHRAAGNIKGKMLSAGIYLLVTSLLTTDHIGNNKIIDIKELPITEDYVYDLETENHHFAAGVGRLVVHNTDSVMVDMNIKDATQCQYWGERLSQEISGVKKGQKKPASDELHEEDVPGLFPPPLEMEFEKAMRLYCIKPKMYAAFLINKRGEFIKKTLKDNKGQVIKVFDENEMLIKGIPLVRRDRTAFLKNLYKQILMMIMLDQPFKHAVELLFTQVNLLITGQVSYDLLKSSRKLGANYKSASNFMKKFSDGLKEEGKMINPGDRLEFLVIKKEVKLIGEKMVLVTDYVDSLNKPNPYEIDYLHYLDKLEILDKQLFSIGFKEVKLLDVSYKPSKRESVISLDRLTKILYKMVINHYNMDQFKTDLLKQIDLL